MAKRANTGRRGGGRGDQGGFEVEETTEAAAPMSMEVALVLVTFVSLIAALILSQLELSNSYGQGLL